MSRTVYPIQKTFPQFRNADSGGWTFGAVISTTSPSPVQCVIMVTQDQSQINRGLKLIAKKIVSITNTPTFYGMTLNRGQERAALLASDDQVGSIVSGRCSTANMHFIVEAPDGDCCLLVPAVLSGTLVNAQNCPNASGSFELTYTPQMTTTGTCTDFNGQPGWEGDFTVGGCGAKVWLTCLNGFFQACLVMDSGYQNHMTPVGNITRCSPILLTFGTTDQVSTGDHLCCGGTGNPGPEALEIVITE